MAANRRLSRGFGLLAALGFILAAGGMTGPASAAVANPVGISPGGDLLWLSNSDLDRELDLYQSMGMQWVRVDFDWPSIESKKGSFTWTATDRVVQGAHARGLKVLALPTYSPDWATTVAGNNHAGPKNPADFANFVAKAASRYAPLGVAAWEIWNEPNLDNFWAPKPSPAAYATLLKAAHGAIKAVDSSATVVAGALSPATDPSDGSQISPAVFTARMYANGAKGFFDALSVHPYCYPAMPDDSSTGSWNTFQRLPLVHDVMSTNGDGNKPIWLTEYGAPTGTGTDAVSEARQAQLLSAGISAADDWSWTGPLFFYGGRDRGTDLTDREQNFGFVRHDFSTKPAHAALLAAISGTPVTPAPVATTPSPPTSLTVTGASSTSATLTWSVAASDKVTGYQIRIRRGTGSWQTMAKVSSKEATATVSGLRASSTYEVRVAAVNAAGTSDYSPSVRFKTPRVSVPSPRRLQSQAMMPHGILTNAAQDM